MTRIAVPLRALPDELQQRVRRLPRGHKRKKGVTLAQLKRAQQRAKTEERAHLFKVLCRQNGIPQPTREYVFDTSPAKRKFRFDFCWIEERLAVECDGGIWTSGSHGRGTGITRDHAKRNLATIQGWRVLHCVPKDLNSDATIELVRAALTPSETT